MTSEFRRRPRRTVSEPITVTDAMTGELVGRIGNLSETGMLLAARAPLNADALYQFQFRLPGGSGDFEVGAHLLWIDAHGAQGDTSSGMSWAGFRFIAMPDDQARRLNAWAQAQGVA